MSSFSRYILQVQACLEPKGYLLFLLKECWLFNLSCCTALSLFLPLSIVLDLHKLSHIPSFLVRRKINSGYRYSYFQLLFSLCERYQTTGMTGNALSVEQPAAVLRAWWCIASTMIIYCTWALTSKGAQVFFSG